MRLTRDEQAILRKARRIERASARLNNLQSAIEGATIDSNTKDHLLTLVYRVVPYLENDDAEENEFNIDVHGALPESQADKQRIMRKAIGKHCDRCDRELSDYNRNRLNKKVNELLDNLRDQFEEEEGVFCDDCLNEMTK